VSCVHTRLVACLHTPQISLPGNTRPQELVNDSFRFAQAFSDAIERHPLHVYSTALLFTPVDTMLYRNFHDIRRDPWLAQGAEKSWSPLLLASHDMEACLVLQFSFDSTQVLSSAKDSISIHDATTGALTIGPIPGRQCCFSPDGSFVISAWQHLLNIWDPMSGVQVMESLPIGPDPINSIIVSSDGALIAYSSLSTVHVWNVKSDTKIFTTAARRPETIRTHISCMSFSPSSTRIVAGSRNGMIFSWDCSSGAEIFEPIRGHWTDIFGPNRGRWGEVASSWEVS